MGRNYTYYDADKMKFNYSKLVGDYLSDNPVVRCKRIYYSYNSAKGIYSETVLDEIQLGLARYYESITRKSWSVKNNREIIEKLRIAIPDVEEMDIYKDKICLSNCVLDLKTGLASEHSHRYLFLHYSNVVYDRNAKCPLFEQFLKQITMNNKERRNTLVEFMGLCLSKEIGFGTSVVLKGSGCNGKSVYCNILCALLGEGNYTTISLKDLPSFGSGKIPGKRLVIMSEISRSSSVSVMSNELKQIASGEIMSCNQKYKPISDMRPYAKVLILTNHEIGFLEDDSEGALRRVYIIPFEYYIRPEDRDFHLEEKLLRELSGILNLALKGYQRLVKNGYMYSSKQESDRIISDILKSENPFRSFVREKIEYSAGSKLSYNQINNSFIEWCKFNDISLGEGNSMKGNRLEGRAIFKEISNYYNIERYKSNGSRGVKNVSLKSKKS